MMAGARKERHHKIRACHTAEREAMLLWSPQMGLAFAERRRKARRAVVLWASFVSCNLRTVEPSMLTKRYGTILSMSAWLAIGSCHRGSTSCAATMGNASPRAVTASEGTAKLNIGSKPRDDEHFGNYTYRHEVVDGVTYPPGQTKAKIDLMRKEYKTRPGDVYIATFPKSGTTWTQQVLMLLKEKGEQGSVPVMRAIPWIERVIAAEGRDAIAVLDKMPGHTPEGGRWFKSHSPWQFVPKGEGVKYIVAARNPKDTMVSMFHHAKSKVEFEYEGDWNNWYEIFLQGKCESGDWFNFTLGYWEAAKANPDAFLFFTFEEMKRDPKAVIQRIADFVGLPYDNALLDVVAKKSSFDAMKKNPLANCQQVPQKGLPHMRKGEVGDWRNYFTVAQSEAFDELYHSRMTRGNSNSSNNDANDVINFDFVGEKMEQ